MSSSKIIKENYDKKISGAIASVGIMDDKPVVSFINIKDDTITGMIMYNENGKPVMYTAFENNLDTFLPKNMVQFHYDEKGKLKAKQENFIFAKSMLDLFTGAGTALTVVNTYYENGKIKSKIFLERGEQVGVWDYYDEDGKLKIKIDFNDVVDGYFKRTAVFKNYYQIEYIDKNGKINGWTSLYDNDGKLLFKFDVNDDVLLGNKLYYDENGKLATKVFESKDESYFEEYYDDGSLKERFDSSSNKDDEFKTSLYYPNGNLKSKTEYIYGKILYNDFYDNGNERYNISNINDDDSSYCINEKGEKIDIEIPDEMNTIDIFDLGCGKFQFVNSDRKLFNIVKKLEALKD